MRNRESREQTKVLNYLKQLEMKGIAWAVKTIVSNRVGTPDIITCLDGRFIAIEMKSPGGKATKAQIETQRRIEAAGGIYQIATSLEQIIELIEGLKCQH